MRLFKNIPFILKFITFFSGNAVPVRNNTVSIANSTMPIASSTMSISNNVSSNFLPSDLDNIDDTLHRSHNIVSKIEETIGFNSANPKWVEALEFKESDEINHILSHEATDLDLENTGMEADEVDHILSHEAIGFNPENVVGLMEVKGVTYGLDSQGSTVKLLISHQSKTYEQDLGISVVNEFKDQLSLTLIEDSGNTVKIGIISPEEGLNEREEEYERLSLNIYMVELSENGVSVKYLSEAELQTNAGDYNDGNSDNEYYFPRVVKTRNSDFIVFAHNFKNQQLIAWLLEPDKNGQLKPLVGRKSIIERKLFKFDKPGQLAFSEETIFYSQRVKGQMGIFPFNIEELTEKLRDGNKVDECLLANRACIINTSPSVKSEGEISFMQYVTNQNGEDLIAFIEEDQSSKKQKLFFVKASNEAKLVYEFTDRVEQLYVRSNGQSGFTVTAVSRENIKTFYVDNLFHHSGVTFIPVRDIKSLSDFAGIINGYLTLTTKESTEQPTPSTSHKVTEDTSQSTTLEVKTTTEPTEPTTSATPEPMTTDTSQSTTLEAKATEEPTKVTTSATPNPITTDIPQTPTPNGVQTTLSGSTQRVFTTVPSSTEYERSTASQPSTATYPPQPTFSPRTQLARAGRSNDKGAIAGGTIGITVFFVLVVLGAYKFIKRRSRNNAVPPSNSNGENRSSQSSNVLIDFSNTQYTNSHGGVSIGMDELLPTSRSAADEEMPLNSVSVGDITPASSPSPGGSRSSSPTLS